jgi:hypothetical protein
MHQHQFFINYRVATEGTELEIFGVRKLLYHFKVLTQKNRKLLWSRFMIIFRARKLLTEALHLSFGTRSASTMGKTGAKDFYLLFFIHQ